jgi:hypothetical protein
MAKEAAPPPAAAPAAEAMDNPEALRLIIAAIALHGILSNRDVTAESHANVARDALGLADALIKHAE